MGSLQFCWKRKCSYNVDFNVTTFRCSLERMVTLSYSTSNFIYCFTSLSFCDTEPSFCLQQRFRNLIQIIGCNIGLDKDRNTKYLNDISYYYTLHFSTMSAPFYTSEKISKEHPKWSEINFKDIQPSFGSAKGDYYIFTAKAG